MKTSHLPEIWWKETVFYQIYMPSFCDSNGDGYSDFTGMTGKLDYIRSLGIRGIWLTPFLLSPKIDNGYDVASYTDIDPTYGTHEDFVLFLKEAHQRDIKVIIDMVFNHTSTDHVWFREARSSKDNLYRNYYIWKDAPNNWESFFGGPAWEFDPITNQYYYHKFDRQMADLNWSNPEIKVEIEGILRYWLESGIDGFRLDVINFLTTDQDWKDNPEVDGKQIHQNDIDQQGIYDAIRHLKSIVDEYDSRFMVGEIGSDQLGVIQQYQASDLLDVVFNFNLGSLPQFSVANIYKELQRMETDMYGYPTLFFSSHDMPRMIDRLAEGNNQRAATLAALILTAKGVPFIYYGEEIGMHNIKAVYPEEIVDIQGISQYRLALSKGKSNEEALIEGNKHNRDQSRSPMQWNTQAFAGFTTHKPWIKINENYKWINVQAQQEDEESIWNVYRELISLRNSERTLQYGEYERMGQSDNRILFTRVYQGEKITVLLNFGEKMKVELPKDSVCLMGNTMLQKDGFIIYKEKIAFPWQEFPSAT